MKRFLIFFLALNIAKASFKIPKSMKSLIDDYFLPEDSVKAKLADKSWEIVYKNLMPPQESFKGERTVTMSGNSELPWGANFEEVGFNPTRYEITRIDPAGQFGNLEISIDSTITKINDIPLSETSIENNYEEFKILLKRGGACTLTFKSNQFALLQHQKSKELLLKAVSNDEVYDDYVKTVQTYLEKKQWQKAYAPWSAASDPPQRSFYTLPANLHRTLQHNLIDFIDVNEKMRVMRKNHLRDALEEQDVALTKKLISRDAKVDVDGLISAIYGGSAECTKVMLEANPKAVNERSERSGMHNWTPLLYAVSCDSSIECAAMLVKFGANLKARNENGRTALELAINRHAHQWYHDGTRYGDRKEYIQLLALAELVQKSQKKEYFERFKQN